MEQGCLLGTLLEQKLQLLNTIANVGMLWWVSSVVFCGSILGAIWINRHEVAGAPFFGWLSVLLGVFFFSIVLFGVCMIIATGAIRYEVESIIEAVDLAKHSRHVGFLTVQIGYAIGTTSFLIVTIIWALLWKTIIQEHKSPRSH